MKSKLMIVLALVSILVMLVSVAATPAKVTGVTLVESKYQPGKGIVFKFEVSGEDVGGDDYTGAVYYSGNEYGLSCNWNGETDLLVCVAGDALAQLDGKTVTGNINGFPFSVVVPTKFNCAYWEISTVLLYYWDGTLYGDYWNYVTTSPSGANDTMWVGEKVVNVRCQQGTRPTYKWNWGSTGYAYAGTYDFSAGGWVGMP